MLFNFPMPTVNKNLIYSNLCGWMFFKRKGTSRKTVLMSSKIEHIFLGWNCVEMY